METAKIDFVITWVDEADPIWYKEKLETLKKQGKTIILISHNLFHVYDISDRICVIKNGI